MTRLELAICEAENNGEIDIYTRDIMLDMVNESTAQYRHIKQIQKEEAKVNKKLAKTARLHRKYLKEANIKKDHELTMKMSDLNGELIDIERRYDKTDPGDHAQMAYYCGHDDNEEMRDYGRKHAKRNPWRYNYHRDEPKPGRYKTTNGLKESVLEEIYEAELNGDITPEERKTLIDYMSY